MPAKIYLNFNFFLNFPVNSLSCIISLIRLFHNKHKKIKNKKTALCDGFCHIMFIKDTENLSLKFLSRFAL